MEKKKIGLVLSGGGFRGLMHLGVLQALEEKNLQPREISATSFGGFIGAFYAAEYPPKEILHAFKEMKLWPFFTSRPGIKGLLSIRPLARFLASYLPKSFDQLQLPLCVNATDLEFGESVFFTEGDLIDPLLASACVPILFKPINWNGKVLVDGGILNNLPVEPLIERECDFIIGCNSNHSGTKPVKHYQHVLERTFNLAINQNVDFRKQHLSVLIEPPQMANYLTFDWKHAETMFDIGYQHAMMVLEAHLSTQ
ncbi:MAG: patatin-like phospholipase family protein [Flammeovirgaceae bacterium]